jgi:hypothetical protein
VHKAFSCFFVEKTAENMLVDGGIRVACFSERFFDVDFLFRQVLLYYFFPFFTKGWFRILAADDCAATADIK